MSDPIEQNAGVQPEPSATPAKEVAVPDTFEAPWGKTYTKDQLAVVDNNENWKHKNDERSAALNRERESFESDRAAFLAEQKNLVSGTVKAELAEYDKRLAQEEEEFKLNERSTNELNTLWETEPAKAARREIEINNERLRKLVRDDFTKELNPYLKTIEQQKEALEAMRWRETQTMATQVSSEFGMPADKGPNTVIAWAETYANAKATSTGQQVQVTPALMRESMEFAKELFGKPLAAQLAATATKNVSQTGAQAVPTASTSIPGSMQPITDNYDLSKDPFGDPDEAGASLAEFMRQAGT